VHRLTAHVLLDLGVRSAVVLTDDARDAVALDGFGIPVAGVAPLQGAVAPGL
jgi:3,4-dihydroxy 2-butanone 4-phosphate synthase/GTP cyclohydrolase II